MARGRRRDRPPGADEAGLLDHYWRVQREEARLQVAMWRSRRAHRLAIWALFVSGAGILLAAIALLKG